METELILHSLIIATSCMLLPCMSLQKETKEKYLLARKTILAAEKGMTIGGNLPLNSKEKMANTILMKFKETEINASRAGSPFPPDIHFFKGKSLIEKSDVFKIIAKMPKGAALHLHDTSITDIRWLVDNVTYRQNCYMCRDANNKLQFRFLKFPPPQNPGCPWVSVSQERQKSGNTTKFNQMLYNSMSLIVDDPKTKYPDINAVWVQFLALFDVANGLVTYQPVFRDYFYEALNEFRMDNVQYIEFRGLLPQTYDLTGKVYDKYTTMKIYVDTFDQFKKDHPDFSGGKFIYSSLRIGTPSDILSEVKLSIQLKTMFPNYFAGYDLVGQEDPGKPLVYYVDALLYPALQTPPVNLSYFFHAGETDWEGTPTDNNLIDAILLNTTRIGHGYALTKHPIALQMIKKQPQIAVEVNPISNQVLMLLDDLRNHPAASLIADNYPIVISSDDPAMWGALPLSDDFYMAFMALAGEEADLRLLKQLAMNSLQFSAMTQEEKIKSMDMWKYKWDQFIDEVIMMYMNNFNLSSFKDAFGKRENILI